MTDVSIEISDDPAGAAAALLAAIDHGHVALSGGSTVGAAFEHLAALAPDWSGVTVCWGDERAVPPEDERSNYGLAERLLLDRLEQPPRAVHRIEGERGAAVAAEAYDALLDGATLDLALNGIGADGHTASLFPGSPALDERDRRAVAAEARLEPFVDRITLTPPAFAETTLLVYLVAGEAKAEAVRRAFAGDPGAATPASLVRGRRTVALLDPAAASLLG